MVDFNKEYRKEQEAWKEAIGRLTLPIVSTGNNHDHSGGDGAQINHTTLSNIGTNTHAQIDTHIADSTIHFTKASINQDDLGDTVITTPLDNNLMAYDTASAKWINQNAAAAGLAVASHNHDATYAPIAKGVTSGDTHAHSGGPSDGGAQIDHVNLGSIGTNTHAAIDTHISTVLSGTYTPTLTNVANLDASTAYVCQYMRVGSIVTVSGRVDVDPTSAATTTQLGISLPIASNLASSTECSGVAFNPAVAGDGAAILGDAANNRAEMRWVTGSLANHAVYFTFTYRII